MKSINIGEARTQFSRLLKLVERGGEITICRRNVPVARLVSAHPEPRRPGRLKGRIHISEDFDAPLPSELFEKLRA